MVRTYKRRTTKAAWNKAAMEAALEAVRSGMKIRKAADRFQIHESTIRKYLKKGNAIEPTLGRKPVFSKAQEKDISDHLLCLAKSFYGISKLELRKIIYEYAEKNKIKHPFCKLTKMAGYNWVNGFLTRNPGLSIRKPEATSLSRIVGFNKTEVTRFFTNLESVIEKYPTISANDIYNVDETGISTVQKPCPIIAPKGQKQVGKATSWERGRNITVVCAMGAGGKYIPPMFIYPRLRMTPALQRGGPPGSIYHCSKSGWITEDLFIEWLVHFEKHAKPTADNPVLLLMDNHCTHISLRSYNFCKEHNIVVLSIPPHTSHRLQPLDVTFFGPLKAALNREYDLYLKNHPYQKITPYDIAPIFTKAYLKTATMEKAISGFKSCGIFPINPEKFSDDDFVAEAVLPKVPVLEMNELEAHRTAVIQELQDEPNEVNDDTTTNEISIQELAPLPGPSGLQPKTARKTRTQHSEIITSTPMKTILEAAAEKKANISKGKNKDNEQKRKKKNDKKRKSKKKINRKELDDSSSDEEAYEEKLCVDSDSDVDPIQEENEEVCMYCYEFGRNGEIWFCCGKCKKWCHKECSGKSSVIGFICDFCAPAVASKRVLKL